MHQKYEQESRYPEMHQTKKGNQWYFGVKMHVGTDMGSGLIHTVKVTPANVHDETVAHKLLRKDDMVVYGDFAYCSLEKHEEIKNNENFSKIKFRTNKQKTLSKKRMGWKRRNQVVKTYRISKNTSKK